MSCINVVKPVDRTLLSVGEPRVATLTLSLGWLLRRGFLSRRMASNMLSVLKILEIYTHSVVLSEGSSELTPCCGYRNFLVMLAWL